MAYRSQKASFAAIVAAVALAPGLWGQQELRYEVEHRHRTWWDCAGVLAVTGQGISYQEAGKKSDQKPEDLHHARWDYEDIQQIHLSPQKLTVLTYEDRKWLLGMDKQWEFRLGPGQTFDAAYDLLKNRLDQRFVAAFAERDFRPVWEIPVKLLGRIKGSEGILEVGTDRIVYRTDARNASRTWRLADIENVSTSGPFQLTITTHERAKFHYGNLKAFNFQLKRALNEKQYDQLWQHVNGAKGLEFLRPFREPVEAAARSTGNSEENPLQ